MSKKLAAVEARTESMGKTVKIFTKVEAWIYARQLLVDASSEETQQQLQTVIDGLEEELKTFSEKFDPKKLVEGQEIIGRDMTSSQAVAVLQHRTKEVIDLVLGETRHGETQHNPTVMWGRAVLGVPNQEIGEWMQKAMVPFKRLAEETGDQNTLEKFFERMEQAAIEERCRVDGRNFGQIQAEVQATIKERENTYRASKKYFEHIEAVPRLPQDSVLGWLLDNESLKPNQSGYYLGETSYHRPQSGTYTPPPSLRVMSKEDEKHYKAMPHNEIVNRHYGVGPKG